MENADRSSIKEKLLAFLAGIWIFPKKSLDVSGFVFYNIGRSVGVLKRIELDEFISSIPKAKFPTCIGREDPHQQ